MRLDSRHMSIAALALTAGIGSGLTAWADPPGRVARLNYISGAVSFRPSTLDAWERAVMNQPLTTGDHLLTDGESWAELHIGSTAVRLAPRTTFSFLNLDDQTTQIRLVDGAMDVCLRQLDRDHRFEIGTPSASIQIARPGVYRIDVFAGGQHARLTVRRGAAEVATDADSLWVYDGQAAAIDGVGPTSRPVEAGPADAWEQWCRDRDRQEEQSTSLQYVSSEMTGYEDLDEHGTWSAEAEHGWVWQPRVAVADWAPYRHGRWRWIEPWGWTWIDAHTWGFAPFHYGRWAHLGGRWVWIPGSRAARPVYAPALVAFVGGEHWGASFGFGLRHPVAWFALGPGELWWPHFRAGHAYIRRVNTASVRLPGIDLAAWDPGRGTYRNRGVRGAVTAVSHEAFVSGRVVSRLAVTVEPRMAMTSRVTGMGAPVVPRAQSVGGAEARAVPRPGTTARETTVLAREVPPAPAVPFRARERALATTGGRPLDEQTLDRLRSDHRPSISDAQPARLAGERSVPRSREVFRSGETPRPGEASQPGDGARSGEAARVRAGHAPGPALSSPPLGGQPSAGANTPASGIGWRAGRIDTERRAPETRIETPARFGSPQARTPREGHEAAGPAARRPPDAAAGRARGGEQQAAPRTAAPPSGGGIASPGARGARRDPGKG